MNTTTAVWTTHEQYAARFPDREHTAAAYEQLRAAWHQQQHGDLNDYEARREFPCPGTFRFTDQTGPVWIAECDACLEEVGVPKTEVSGAALAVFRRGSAHLPGAYLDQPFAPTPGTGQAREWLKRYVAGYQADPIPAPALVGDTGRGKTHLLTLALDSLMRRYGTDCMYASTTMLLDAAQGNIDAPRAEQSGMYDRACTCEVLALDDLGAERATDWRLDRLAHLVDQRYLGGLPLLLATNVAKEDWPELIGARTASRLRALTIPVLVTGEDWRLRDAA